MKIKRTVKMRLDELVEHVWDNKICPSTFTNNNGGVVHFNSVGKFCTANSFISPHSTFTVETEEELTEKTELRGVTTFIEKPNGIFPAYTASASIRECLDSLTDVENEPLKIFNGITEIWSKDTGIPEEGVIEV